MKDLKHLSDSLDSLIGQLCPQTPKVDEAPPPRGGPTPLTVGPKADLLSNIRPQHDGVKIEQPVKNKVSKRLQIKPKIKKVIAQRKLDLALFPEKEVWRANELCEAKLEMHNNLLSNKIFCTLIANLQPDTFPNVAIDAKLLNEQEDLLGSLYKRIEYSADLLARSRITKVFFSSKTKKERGFSFQNIFQELTYDNGIIFGRFNDQMGPLLLKLKEKFTVLNLNTLLSFQSFYSQRIYEILSASRYKGDVEYDLCVLQDMIAFPLKLRNDYNQFKNRVLEQSKKDIETITDLKFDYFPIRANGSKKIVAIKFIFSNDHDFQRYNKYDSNFTLAEGTNEFDIWNYNPEHLVIPYMNLLNGYTQSAKTKEKIARAASKAKFDLKKFIQHLERLYYSIPRPQQGRLSAYIIGSCQIKLGLKTPPDLKRAT
jgi:hypothetical protein